MKPNDLSLRLFRVYRQHAPVQLSKLEWRADLRHVGDVWAKDNTHALCEAQAQHMAVAPLVEEVKKRQPNENALPEV